MHTTHVDAASWIRRYRPTEDATTRLVCFPHAGGSASFFHPVAKTHGGTTDVVALQYPGRQDRLREPAIDNIDEYADRITTVLATLPDVPTVFFGHSMGALIAFEVAHRLEEQAARSPLSVIASGRRAPSTTRPERVHERDDDGIIAELELLNGTDSALLADEEILRMAMPAIRNDYIAVESHPSRNRTVACPLTVLVGTQDPKTTLDEAAQWQEHTTGPFRMREFPGGHFYLTGHQAEVNEEITVELQEVLLASRKPGA